MERIMFFESKIDDTEFILRDVKYNSEKAIGKRKDGTFSKILATMFNFVTEKEHNLKVAAEYEEME